MFLSILIIFMTVLGASFLFCTLFRKNLIALLTASRRQLHCPWVPRHVVLLVEAWNGYAGLSPLLQTLCSCGI